jgi:hypothetical protein
MVRAAATGRLDYSKADSNSGVWLMREKLMLLQLERDIIVDMRKLRHLQQVSTAIWPAGDTKGDMFKEHYERGNAHIEVIGKLQQPYIKWDTKDVYKSELRTLRDEYTKQFGDPSSPEARARNARDLESIKKSKLMAQQKAEAEMAATKRREAELQSIRNRRVAKR